MRLVDFLIALTIGFFLSAFQPYEGFASAALKQFLRKRRQARRLLNGELWEEEQLPGQLHALLEEQKSERVS